mmetsp:Transcript_48626/g.154052  ORF Transcript_48626/g.154052 Transcript_48626/m.154052 type:complete len:220 (+) Transcript_48626:255-914(+)
MAVQALFEASMYIFVLVFAPAIVAAAPAAAREGLPFGKVFSCFMAACAVGSATFSLCSAKGLRAEAFLLPVLLGAAGALYLASSPPAATMLQRALSMSHKPLYLVFCFAAFEAAVGVYFPAVGGLRAAYLPGAQRGAIMALTRVPLNLLVIAVALARDRLGDTGALRCAAAAQLLAAAALASLWARGGAAGKGEAPAAKDKGLAASPAMSTLSRAKKAD